MRRPQFSLASRLASLALVNLLFVLPAVVLGTTGCGYTSEYAAPADGRPRPVWSGNRIAVETAGAPLTGACVSDAVALSETHVLRTARPVDLSAGTWTPRYYGPPLIIVHPGLAPVLLRPPIFVPGLSLGALPRPGLGGGVSSGSSLRLGSSGDSGKALVVLAVIALVVLPAVDLALAVAPAESQGPTAQAIDQVNAMNDLLRTEGSPCAYPQDGGPQ